MYVLYLLYLLYLYNNISIPWIHIVFVLQVPTRHQGGPMGEQQHGGMRVEPAPRAHAVPNVNPVKGPPGAGGTGPSEAQGRRRVHMRPLPTDPVGNQA